MKDRQVGNPRRGRTSQVVRIPAGWDKDKMIDVYTFMVAKLDGRREGLRSGLESSSRDWTHFDRLMIELATILDSEEM